MPKLFEYQEVAEPVLAALTDEVVLLDKWYQPTAIPTPPRRPLVRTGYQFSITDPTFAKAVTVDRWWQPASERLYSRKPLTREGWSVAITEPTVYVVPSGAAALEWHPASNVPLRKPPTLRFQFEANVTEPIWSMPPYQQHQPRLVRPPLRQQAEVAIVTPTVFTTINVAEWMSRLSEPVRGRAPRRLQHESNITEDFVPKFSSWWRQASEPVRGKPRLIQQTDATTFGAAIFVWQQLVQPAEPMRRRHLVRENVFVTSPQDVVQTPDGWQAQHVMPTRAKPRRLSETLVVAPRIDEVITLDKWWRQPVELRLNRKPIVAEGTFRQVVEPFVTMAMDSWYVQPSEPRRQKAKPVGEGISVLLPEPPILVDKWYRQPVELRTGKRPLTAEGMVARLIEPLVTTTLDSWYMPTSEPRRGPVRRTQPLAGVEVVDVAVTLDKWWREAVDIRRTRPQPTREGGSRGLIEPLVTTALDSWYVQPSEPRRGKARPVAEGIFVWLTDLAITVDRWWQPASEPARTKPRAVAEGASLSIVEASLLVVPSLASWYRPTAEPIRKPSRPVAEGQAVLIVAPSIFVWQSLVESPMPTRRIKPTHGVRAEVFTVEPAPDGWQAQIPEPVRRRRVTVTESVTIHVPTVFMSDWYVRPADPMRPRQRQNVGQLVTPLDGDVTAVGWQQPTSEPIRRKRQPISAFGVMPTEFAAVGFSWYVRPDEPIRPARKPTGDIRSITEPSLFVVPSVASWYVQHPTAPKRIRLPSGAFPSYRSVDISLVDVYYVCVEQAMLAVPFVQQAAVTGTLVEEAQVAVSFVNQAQIGCG